MAQKKAGEVEAFLSRPDTSFPIVLLYGPDAGLVAERAARVAALSGVAGDDPFATVTLAGDELERNIGRLFDEARTVSLFGGRRLVRVRGAGGGGKALAAAVADLGAKPPEGATVVIEAGDLKPSAPLRAAAERAPAAMALPCYPDEGRSLDALIDAEMKAANLKIGREAREALKHRLGANRLASRGEVQKLALYGFGTEEISVADVEAVVGDVSAETVEEAIDAAASGEVKRLPELIERLRAAGVQGFLLHQALLRHFQALQVMREAVEKRGESVSRTVEGRRPNFRRKPAFEAALSAWTLEALGPALSRIEADILLSRKEAGLASTIVEVTLLGLAVEAARLRARPARPGRG